MNAPSEPASQPPAEARFGAVLVHAWVVAGIVWVGLFLAAAQAPYRPGALLEMLLFVQAAFAAVWVAISIERVRDGWRALAHVLVPVPVLVTLTALTDRSLSSLGWALGVQALVAGLGATVGLLTRRFPARLWLVPVVAFVPPGLVFLGATLGGAEAPAWASGPLSWAQTRLAPAEPVGPLVPVTLQDPAAVGFEPELGAGFRAGLPVPVELRDSVTAWVGSESPYAAVEGTKQAWLRGHQEGPRLDSGSPPPFSWQRIPEATRWTLQLHRPAVRFRREGERFVTERPGLPPGGLAVLRGFDAIETAGHAPSEEARDVLQAFESWRATRAIALADPSVRPDLYALLGAPGLPEGARRFALGWALGLAMTLFVLALLRRWVPFFEHVRPIAIGLMLAASGASLALRPKEPMAAREDAIVSIRPGQRVAAVERFVHVRALGATRVSLAGEGLIEPILFERPEPRPWAVAWESGSTTVRGLELRARERRLFRRVRAETPFEGPLELLHTTKQTAVVNRTGASFVRAFIYERGAVTPLDPLPAGGSLAIPHAETRETAPFSAFALSLDDSVFGLVEGVRRELRSDRPLLILVGTNVPEALAGPNSVEPGKRLVVLPLGEPDR